MHALLEFLNTSPEVTASAALILLVALCAYLFWYLPAIRSVRKGLQSVTKAIPKDPVAWADAKDTIRSALNSHPYLALSWLETQERVFELSVSGQTKVFMFGLPKDLWNSSDVFYPT